LQQFEIQVKASDGIILYSSLHHCEQKSTASNQQVCYIKEEGRFDLTLERSGTYCFALYTGVSWKWLFLWLYKQKITILLN